MTELPDATGSQIRTINTTREAKVYPLFEAEMNSLGVLNFFSSLCFSAAAAALSFWFALKMQKEVTEDMSNVTEAGHFMLKFGPSICGWAAICFLLVGVAIFVFRGWNIWSIKKQAVSRITEIEDANT